MLRRTTNNILTKKENIKIETITRKSVFPICTLSKHIPDVLLYIVRTCLFVLYLTTHTSLYAICARFFVYSKCVFVSVCVCVFVVYLYDVNLKFFIFLIYPFDTIFSLFNKPNEYEWNFIRKYLALSMNISQEICMIFFSFFVLFLLFEEYTEKYNGFVRL